MMRSTTPLAEPLSCHPVHRANAMLREALLGDGHAAPDPAEVWDDSLFRPEPAPVDIAHEPRGVASPASLTALQNLAPDDASPSECQSIVIHSTDGSAPQTSLADESEGEDVLDYAVQQQLQTMVQAFHQRQRQASLVVACSIIAALILTLGGLILLFTMTDSVADGREGAAGLSDDAGLKPVKVHANLAAKGAPLVIQSRSETFTPSFRITEPDARVILALPERPLALGPLLPLGSARYLLLRGLPDDAALSAGRRTGPGTWMVKGEDVAGLTLTLGKDASGDYPTEAYLLGTEDGPQARRRLILRVDPSPQMFTANGGLTWPVTPSQGERTEEPHELEALHERARLLVGRGNIPTARRILTDLAERGSTDAAYELALTYDQEVLDKAGLGNVEGDMEIAQAWYAHAAQEGHAGAAQRLRTFSKPRAGA